MLCAVMGSSFASAAQGKMGDSWVTAKTKIALFADPRVKGSEVSVETKGGLVIIRGKVDTEEARTAAAEIAKTIDGAASVKNELQVVARARREVTQEKDEVVNARVTKKLAGWKHASIKAQTNAGVVSLSGSADDIITSARASWKAWSVDGVKFVKNDLTIVAKK